METHQLESGQTLRTHHADECVGQWCAIHRPMPGPWSSWPRYWRGDRRILERLCPHGVGHPAAEMAETSPSWELIHGCDGCPCSPPQQEEE